MNEGKEQVQLLLHQSAEKAARQCRAVAGRFISGPERMLAQHEAKQAGVMVDFNGGWDDAERVQCCFYPYDEEPEYSMQWVQAEWNPKFGNCDHRALLGSLMGLGIDRSYFGDLIAEEGRAWVCCLPQVAVRLPMEWQQAGRISIKVKALDSIPDIKKQPGTVIRDTVASLRLDSVLECGMRSSRSHAAQLIRQGAVMVDHIPELRIDKNVKEGTLLSIHGFGRIRLIHVGETTKKGRLPIEVEVFSSR